MRWIPAARSSNWWLYAGISTLLITVLLWIIRFGLLGQKLDAVHFFRFMLLALFLSLLFSIVGWLGARKLWFCSNIGVIAGLIVMATYTGERSGWEDLISLLVFFQLTAIGFIAGIVVELAYMAVKRWKKNNNY